jgi:molybdenum cofactor sulfurtransferase
MMPNSFIEYAATKENISLRTGCMCNPGGAAAILGAEEFMQKLCVGITLQEFEARVGREMGVVRISLGLVTSFEDVWKIIQFSAIIGKQRLRQAYWDSWSGVSSGIGHAI